MKLRQNTKQKRHYSLEIYDIAIVVDREWIHSKFFASTEMPVQFRLNIQQRYEAWETPSSLQ